MSNVEARQLWEQVKRYNPCRSGALWVEDNLNAGKSLEYIVVNAQDIEQVWLLGTPILLPNNVLQLLAQDSSIKVRLTVARYVDLPHDLVVKLSGDGAWQVRAAIAKRYDLPNTILTKLADDRNHAVKEAIHKFHPDFNL